MISERLIKEETLEGPVFEALFNQPLNEEKYEGPSVLAGMPGVDLASREGQKSLPAPRAAYPLPSQFQPPHNGEKSTK
jgi:cell division protease FtsH